MLSREEPNIESGTQARSSLYLVVKGVWSSQTNTHRLKVSLWLPGTSSEAYSVLWSKREREKERESVCVRERDTHTHTERGGWEKGRGGRERGREERRGERGREGKERERERGEREKERMDEKGDESK